MGDVASASKLDREGNEPRWFDLAYLLFAYLPLGMQPTVGKGLYATLLATAVFLPIFLSFQRRSADTSPWWGIGAVAAIGYALIPFNVGGNTFIVYAAAMCASTLSVRTTVIVFLLLLVTMTVEFALVIPNLRIALSLGGMMGTVGGIVTAGILIARGRERRDAQLRLTQDEVARLAAMAERERIGRDLHDLLGHTLSVVALKSELAGKLIDRDPAAARNQIREVETVARDALAQVREAVSGIRATGLQAELASARLTLLSAEVHLDQRLAPLAIAAPVEQALALAVREAVTNIIRHAAAKRVEIELRQRDGELQLSIADDGCGGITRSGTGLSGMQERLSAVGGSLQIDSSPDAGSRLLLRVPHTEALEHAR